MLEGWHERTWETVYGSIHSYSYKLKGWDLVFGIVLGSTEYAYFLESGIQNISIQTIIFGHLPKPELILSHDVDAVCKTHPIRIKQSAFHIFNSLNLLLKFRIFDSIKKLTKGIKFFLSNEDWWVLINY